MSETAGRKLTEADLGYAAGYLDGEGCFRHDHTPVIEVTNTYPHTLLWMKASFGGSVSLKSAAEGKWRTAYRYRVCGSNAVSICKKLTPLLREKREQAKILVMMSETPTNSETFRCLLEDLAKMKRIDYA